MKIWRNYIFHFIFLTVALTVNSCKKTDFQHNGSNYSSKILLMPGGDSDGGGLEIYSKYKFASSSGGQLYCIIDSYSGSVLIPEGAALMTITEYYVVGFYEGDMVVSQDGQADLHIRKVFFIIDNRGLEYHLPDAKGNFAGKLITGEIRDVQYDTLLGK